MADERKRIEVRVYEDELITQLQSPFGSTEFQQGWLFAIQAPDHQFVESAACRQLSRRTANYDNVGYILDVLKRKADPLRMSTLQNVGALISGYHSQTKLRAIEVLGRQRDYSLEQAVAAGFGESQGRHTYIALTHAASGMFDACGAVVTQAIAASADLNDFAVGHDQGIYGGALAYLYSKVVELARDGKFGDSYTDVVSAAVAASVRVGRKAVKPTAPTTQIFADCILCSADMQPRVREQAEIGLRELCPFAELPVPARAADDNVE